MSIARHLNATPNVNGFEDAVVQAARRLKCERPSQPLYLTIRQAWQSVDPSAYGVAELEGSTPEPWEATTIQTRAFGIADSGQEISGSR